MNPRLLLVLLLLGDFAAGEPSFRLTDATTIQVSWPAAGGKQYELYCSPDLEEWTLLGDRILGVDGTLTVEDDISGTPQKFYRVEEFEEIMLDLLRLKYGTVGNKWVYGVVDDNVLGLDFYTWETEIVRRTEFNGENVVEWIFNRDGSWDRSIYLLDDFSTGIYEVGGEAPGQSPQNNDPPATTLLATFSPGAVVPVNYTSGADAVTEDMRITVEKDPFTVPAGTFTGVIKVVHTYHRLLLGFPVSGTITEWFALEVGLLKHIGESEVLGSLATTTFELQSYEVD